VAAVRHFVVDALTAQQLAALTEIGETIVARVGAER
jgi:hypothetical protein